MEVGQPGRRVGLVDGGVHGPQILGHLVPVLAAREPERVADQVQHTSLHDRQRPGRLDRFRQAFQPVAHDDAHVVDTAVLDLGEDLQPVLGALAAGADPQPENVAFAIDGHTDRCVDRPVGDLAVADLDHDRVDEHDRIHTIEGPVLPLGELADHPVGDLRDRLAADRGAIHLGQMRFDLTRRQPLGRQRDHHLVDTIEAALALADGLRLERAVTITRHVELHRADLGDHRLRPRPVPGVAAIAAGRVVLRIADVFFHLDLQTGLEDLLGQIAQQSTRSDEVLAVGACLFDELLGE